MGLTEQPSRLSRSRNVARRAAERAVEQARSDVKDMKDSDRLEGDREAAKGDSEVHLVVVEEEVAAGFVVEDEAGYAKKDMGKSESFEAEEKVRRAVVKNDRAGEMKLVVKQSRKRSASPKREKKELHPFFRVTANAVMRDRERQKRPRVIRPVVDAWMYVGATVHVNWMSSTCRWELGPSLGGADVRVRGTRDIEFGYYAKSERNCEGVAQRRKVIGVSDVCQDLWAEKYKLDRRVDVISAAATNELVEWLSHWYKDSKERPAHGCESSDDDSDASFLKEQAEIEKETIALITGPVGCGKSTIVGNAARHLGLAVLEINASSCRTGKKVRDIVREATRTHRVSANKIGMPLEGLVMDGAREKKTSNVAASTSARTLILFEEVDELQDDERGFWTCIQELAASQECRRPIICTANKFSHLMRQLFSEEKGPVEADLDRLLIQTKVEQLLNPVAYKHITLPARTERQAFAVLNEVVAAEKISMSSDSISFLAISSQRDSRKAINMLHFWGLKGLAATQCSGLIPEYEFLPQASRPHLSDCKPRSNFCILQGVSGDDISPTMFWVGAENFIKAQRDSAADQQHGIAERPEISEVSAALQKWTHSLEMMSLSDIVVRSLREEARERCLDVKEDCPELCIDDDLQCLYDVANRLSREAVLYSRSYLQFADRLLTIAEIGKRYSPKLTIQPPDNCPKPRRPITSDYMPILRTMAVKEATASVNGARTKNGPVERTVRRTRASMKRGGFWALDLNPCTVSALKRNFVS